MILKELVDYYDRKSKDKDSGIVPLGWENKAIKYVVVLNEDGSFFNLEDKETITEEIDKKSKKISSIKEYLVPQHAIISTQIDANLLYDNTARALGLSEDPKDLQKFQKFKDKITNLAIYYKGRWGEEDRGLKALIMFFNDKSKDDLERVKKEIPEKEKEKKPTVSFRLRNDDSDLICNREKIKICINEMAQMGQNKNSEVTDIITGEKDNLAELHNGIMGVFNAQASGGSLVSYNSSSAESFNKEQGQNVPIGQKSMQKYTTALNYLLRKGSKQKKIINNLTLTFWGNHRGTEENEEANNIMSLLIENPDKWIDEIKTLLESYKRGDFIANSDINNEQFFLLGLAPHNKRLIIKLWISDKYGEIKTNIAKYFEDISIEDSFSPYFSISSLLFSISPTSKSEDVPDNLVTDIIKSIFLGHPFPDKILYYTISRLKKDKSKGEIKGQRTRIGILKAYINRKYKGEIIKMSLDKTQKDIAYRLGRSFAIMERIYEQGDGKKFSEKFYVSASTCPALTIGKIMRMKVIYESKLNEGLKIYYDKMLTEICPKEEENITIPESLNMEQQAYFALGYYQQKQSLFAKNKDKQSIETPEIEVVEKENIKED